MQVAVSLPPSLAQVVGAHDVTATGDEVQHVLRDLESQFSPLAGRLIHDGGLRRFINVYVNGRDIRSLDGLNTELHGGETIDVLMAVAGG